jgi:hypothetical protein
MVFYLIKMDFARKLLDSGSYNVNEVGLKIDTAREATL